ncbi:MAG: DNA internalization-related competence protein ComEC/Rec2 [Candidatus Omnitrophota bacterium]
MNRPLLAAFICLVCGIILASIFKIPFFLALGAALFFVIAALVFSKRNKTLFFTFALISVVFLGASCFYNFSFIPPTHIATKISKAQNTRYIKGRITSDPFNYETYWGQKRAEFVFDTDLYKNNGAWVKTQGLCKVVIFESQGSYNYGDNLILSGDLKIPPAPANPGEFDYSFYLKQQKIYAILEVSSDDDARKTDPGAKLRLLDNIKFKLFTLRKNIKQLIDRYIPSREAALVSAMMLGLRSDLASEIEDAFVKTGTAHILAISGLNLAIIAYVLFMVLGALRLPYNLRNILVIAAIVCYAVLCGAQPPVARAAVMISMFLLARVLNRGTDVYNILSAAGILMLLANPMQIFNAGFILSFGCIFSIIYFQPKIEKLFKTAKNPELNRKMLYLIRPLSISLAVSIGITPVIAYYFNIISPVTIIANLLVVPLTAVLTYTAMAFMFLGSLFSVLAPVFGSSVWFVAFLLEKGVFYMSKIPFAYFYIPDLPVLGVAGYYIFMFLTINRKRLKVSNGVVFIILLLAVNICIWTPLINGNTGKLKMTFLSVEHGDAIFIEFPDKRTMLIDAGSRSAYVDKGEDVVVPYIWHQGYGSLDCMLITHGDVDHFGGSICVINKLKVKTFMTSASPKGETGYAGLINLVNKSPSIKKFIVNEGDKIEGFADVQILALGPPEGFLNNPDTSKNDSSVVLKITYKDISFLLCGDILDKGMEHLLLYKEFLESDIIKVPHHGSRMDEYIYEAFFGFVKPNIAVITASEDYKYPTPAESTLNLLSSTNTKVFTTYKTGAITITTDGKVYGIDTIYNI